MVKVSSCARLIVGLVVGVFVVPSFGSPIVYTGTGTSSLGHPVVFSAEFVFNDDLLTLTLSNESPFDTTDAADTLSSVYFDILSGSTRPALSYEGGSGFVYQVWKNAADTCYYYTPQMFLPDCDIPSDLGAFADGDATWQFRVMNSGTAPMLGFGIGTVGNSMLSPNGFNPAIVGPPGTGMINFAIYRGGDIQPNGILNGRFLVKNTATFTFTGVTGFGEEALVDKVVFGLGTGPDSTVTVSLPEPPLAGMAVASLGSCGMLLRRRGLSAVRDL